MRVFALTNLFPTPERPGHGVFLRHRLKHLGRISGLSLQLLVPTPWFPWKNERFGRWGAFARVPAYDMCDGIIVRYPRYPLIPKLGMLLAPLMMAARLIRPVRRMIEAGFTLDVIDAYYLYPDGVAACLLGKWLDKPVVISALGSDVSQIGHHPIARRMILWATRRAVATTAVCKALTDALEEMGADPAKLHVVEHGVDTELFAPPRDRDAARKALGFSRTTILSVGYLIDRKGHDLAIRAVAELPGVDLHIVGEGPERANLERLARSLNVADRVHFTGQIDQPMLATMLGATDLLANCSDREGIANVLLEALACGTPVAATPIWGSPDVITDPRIGLLFKDRTVPSIVDGIRLAMARQWDRPIIRCHSLRYNWQHTADQHYRIMVQALA